MDICTKVFEASVHDALPHAFHEFTEPVNIVERSQGRSQYLSDFEEVVDVGSSEVCARVAVTARVWRVHVSAIASIRDPNSTP